MKQTQEKFEAMNLEYENLYNEEDDRRDYNSVWYSQVIGCRQTILTKDCWIISQLCCQIIKLPDYKKAMLFVAESQATTAQPSCVLISRSAGNPCYVSSRHPIGTLSP